MDNFKFRQALSYCKSYKEENNAVLNLNSEFITPSFIATVATFIKSNNIQKSNFLYSGDDSYLTTIGFYNELWNVPFVISRHMNGLSYSPLMLLDDPNKTDSATSTINSCIYRLLKNNSSYVNELCEVIGELHDNVWSHGQGLGFSIAQYYQKSNRIEFAIVDCGKGFLRELNSANVPGINNHEDAIRWCITRGNSSKKFKEEFDDGWGQWVPEDITYSSNAFAQAKIPQVSSRDENHHEGLGLAKLVDLVKNTRGNLQIISGDTILDIQNGSDEEKYCRIPYPWNGVIIGCSIPTNIGYTSTSNKDFDDLLSLMTK